MKLSQLPTNAELLDAQLQTDPDVRAEWERTALARLVAIEVLKHRTERGWSQRQLGEVLGMSQPQVARLERGETNPTVETLSRISSGLGIELTINVTPAT